MTITFSSMIEIFEIKGFIIFVCEFGESLFVWEYFFEEESLFACEANIYGEASPMCFVVTSMGFES